MRFLVLVLFVGLILAGASAFADAPRVISFQGKLTDANGVPRPGTYLMIYRLWDSDVGGNMLSEVVMDAVEVDDEGIYQVEIPVPEGVDFDQPLWLGVEVESDGEMEPRYRMTSGPYDFWAMDSDKLDGLDSSEFFGMSLPETLEGSTSEPLVYIKNTGGGPALRIEVSRGLSNMLGPGPVPAGEIFGEFWVHNSSDVPPQQGKVRIGPGCTNTGDYAFVTGKDNTASGGYSAVGGGQGNTASGYGALVGGGVGNEATNTSAAVGGGYQNEASAVSATVAGGSNNVASQGGAAIGGGMMNTASNEWATVSGGRENTATGLATNVGGGYDNKAGGRFSVVGGGYKNVVSDSFATIAGGRENTATGAHSTVGGGMGNTAGGTVTQRIHFGGATVAGGLENNALDHFATVGGGHGNQATANSATVAGGSGCTAAGELSTVGGGSHNTASGALSTVPGGFGNTAEGAYSLATGYKAKADHAGSFVWADVQDEDFVSTAENQFLIRASGGVGIGTSSPADKLDVEGNIRSSGAMISANSLTIDGVNDRITAATGTIGFDDENLVTDGTVQMGGFSMPTSAAEGHVLTSDVSGIGTWQVLDDLDWVVHGNDMYSNNSGNVGIGIKHPGHKLEVHGDLRVSEEAAIGLGCTNPGKFGAFVAGRYNTASGGGATVGGGTDNTASGSQATVGGGASNNASGFRATIAGGDENTAGGSRASVGGGQYNVADGYCAAVGGGINNTASGARSAVAGGDGNTAGGYTAVVGGGNGNAASGLSATVAGGQSNLADDQHAAIGGGWKNTASGVRSVVGGGYKNVASGSGATVPGGEENTASGDFSFAAGRRAKADHSGSFVWADDHNWNFGTTEVNQFLIRASGGVGINTDHPSEALDVGGKIRAGSLICGSVGISTLTIDGFSHRITATSGSIDFDDEDLVTTGSVEVSGFRMPTAAVEGYVLTSDPTGAGTWQQHPAGVKGVGSIDYIPKFVQPSTLANSVICEKGGKIGIGTTNPTARLAVKADADRVVFRGYNSSGRVIVEIGEGLDYAEDFPTTGEGVASGAVMVIDPDNPGKLTACNEAYDRKVAGIVAGANDLNSGVRLGRNIESGDHQAVAIAGRVYCNVDTQYGDIEPGDLLTTSPTPGFAMVVGEYSKAQGAILGKAMEALSGGGTGQILVLVSLQ